MNGAAIELTTKVHRRPRRVMLALLSMLVLGAAPAGAQQTIDAGMTGFDLKRPVLASACEHGCPWGELGDFVKDAMQPLGYEVILCRNCNRDQGPPLVANASYPPAIGPVDLFVGTTTRVNAPVDFGITESGLLSWAYDGRYNYMQTGPFPNLRLIAKIEDPTYLLVAVKASSGITDLSQIAAQHMAVNILGGDSPISQPVLDYYGLTKDAVTSWGGSFENAIIVGQSADPPFDVIANELASPANNPESAFWTKISQKYDLRFFDLPETVLNQLANDKTLGLQRAVAKWGLLRGVDRAIPTVARSGHAVFAREDTPEQAAYDVAKAIDDHREALKWYIRPYSYNSRTAWENVDVPLHPGAKRYYSEIGYFPGSMGNPGCDGGDAAPPIGKLTPGGGGCGVVEGPASREPVSPVAAAALVCLVAARRRRPRLEGSQAEHSET
jgi:TRAP transporter TAXI family solute receptor